MQSPSLGERRHLYTRSHQIRAVRNIGFRVVAVSSSGEINPQLANTGKFLF